MRLIGSLADKQQAEKFAAFLLTQSVQNHLEQENDEFEIWIKDEDSVATAVAELEKFKANPDAIVYAEAVPRARELQMEEVKKRQRLEKNIVSVSGGKLKRNHPLTILIIAICGIVALFTDFGARHSRTKATFRALAFNAVSPPKSSEIADKYPAESIEAKLASVKQGEIWRVITPIFLHFGVFHLLFNMYWMFVLGGQIENRYGSFWYAILIILAAAISNFVQCVVPGDIGGSVPALTGGYLINHVGGMSGVVYALFGFMLMRLSYDGTCNFMLPQSTIMLMLIWLVFCMTPIATQVFNMHVANWAHAIGFLVGLIAGYWPMLMPKKPVKS